MPPLAAIEAEFRRRSLLEFTSGVIPGYEPGWVHREVCARLEAFSRAVADGQEPRLMIFMPPRIGKSTLSSIAFPAWHLGHHPDHEVIQGAYGQDLSRKFSRKCRGLLRDPLYAASFQTTRISLDTSAVDQWETQGGGGYKAVGAGSAVTGQGAHVLILDDTTKNRAEAYSPTQRDKVWDWYCWDMESRLAPGGGVLLVQTRWHHDDLPGRLLERDGTKEEGGLWEVIRYPAIAEVDEPMRKAGEALHPERYPADCAVYTNARKSPLVWSALYQQRPTPETGNLFQLGWFRRWRSADLPPRWDEVILSVDCKLKEIQTGSWAAAQVWGKHGEDAFLLDQSRGRWGLNQTVEVIKSLTAKWAPRRVLVEEKALGAAVIEVLRGQVPGLRAINPKESKVARAHACTPDIEAGRVYVPERTPWLSEWEDEVIAFPAATNDDQVDTMTQALHYLLIKGAGSMALPGAPTPRRRAY